MKYFKPPFSNETLKKQFRVLCLKYHPDKMNGRREHFDKIVEEHEQLKKYLEGEILLKKKTQRSPESPFREAVRLGHLSELFECEMLAL